MKFNIGDKVRYTKEWATPEELTQTHTIIEQRLNPVTDELTRYLIRNDDATYLNGISSTEVVDDFMIELI